MALPTPPNNNSSILNNPFSYPEGWSVCGPFGQLIVGSGLDIDDEGIISASGGSGRVSRIVPGQGISVSSPTGIVRIDNTGIISILPGTGISVSTVSGVTTVCSTCLGTVTEVCAGVGLVGGVIRTTGSIALAPSGVGPGGTYTNPTLTIDTYGRVTTALSSPAVTSISVSPPITISGTTTPTIGILPATITQAGAVMLSDSVADAGSICAASTAAVKIAYDLAVDAIPCSVISSKGALITGDSTLTVTALPVGANGEVLTADSACASGLKWAAGSTVPAATPTVRGVVFGCTSASETSLGSNAFLSGGGGLNVALGLLALSGGNTGSGNVAVGARALLSNTTSSANVGIGLRALCNNTIGESNIGIGPQALCSNTFGSFNVALGSCALCALDGGDCNVSIGLRSGCNITTGCNNVTIGCGAQVANGSGNNQLAIGFSGSNYWITGDGNKAIKPGAGIIDCTASCGSNDYVLTSQGNAIQWKPVSSGIAAPNYGSFLNTGTQIIGLVNVPQPVELNTVVDANGFTLGGNSQIIATNAGTYNLQFSLQLVVATGGGGNVEIWLSKGGNPVPNSNTRFAVKNVNEAEFAALNFVETLTAGEDLELIWVTDDVHIQLRSYAAGANFAGSPAIPSAIVTIVPVGA